MFFDRRSRRRRSLPPPPQRASERKVWVAGKPVPVFASATRRKHMSELAVSRKYVWRYAITCGLLFLAAAMTRNPLVAGVALLVGLAIVTVQLVRDATGRAHRDFFAGFALKHGFSYSDGMNLPEKTPLLGAGDRRSCSHYMDGRLRDSNHSAGLAHYVYETREQRRDRRNRVITIYTPHWFTVCVVDLPRAAATYPGVFLTRRGGLRAKSGWYDKPGLQSIEIEGALLSNKYQLLTKSSQSRDQLMKLFQPSFQAWLTSLELPVCFEFSEGTLVVYVPGKLREADQLETMLLAAEHISAQLMRDSEGLQLVGPSVPPPAAGFAFDRPFPPPPPATKPQIEVVGVRPISSRIGSGSVPPPGA